MLGLEFKESYKNKTASCDGVTSEAIISGKERMKLGREGLKPVHLARCLLSPDSSLICLVFTGDKDSIAAVLQRLGGPSCTSQIRAAVGGRQTHPLLGTPQHGGCALGYSEEGETAVPQIGMNE